MDPMPKPGSTEELARFVALQNALPDLYQSIAPDDRWPHTVVVAPSLSMDPQELDKITGVHHYEERLLFMLMLLRKPRTQLVFLSSQPIHPTIIDYYLHLLPGVPTSHARSRLTLIACNDASSVPLSQKIIDRPRLLQRIKNAIRTETAHLACFNSTALERTLAVHLGIPLYANDPALLDLGTKSGCREIFKEAGVDLADGFERLESEDDIVQALATLKSRHPDLSRGVVKLNDGFSGEGNALFSFKDAPKRGLDRWIRNQLPTERLKFAAKSETWPRFREKYAQMQGIVECFIDGNNKQSPSSQARVNPLGEASSISTHDQVLGGPGGQVFLGCTFPAQETYRLQVQEAGMRVARVLASKGVLGRFATDFISVEEPDGWKHYAIEVNLRKGGTTHPFLTLKFLTDGRYDEQTGLFHAPTGKAKCYYASDTLQKPSYRGLTPDDLVDIAVYHGLHFDGASQRGVVFHLVGALSEFGKLGIVSIGDNPQQALFLYNKTVKVLDAETRGHGTEDEPPTTPPED